MSIGKHIKIYLDLALVVIFSLLIGVTNPYAQDDDYRIGVEDVLYINVWKNEQLTREVMVRPDGKISFPLLDDIKVSGLTPIEVKNIITEKLASYVQDPEVTVILGSINSYRVYILGAVASPGELTLRKRTSLLQLLALVGGPTLMENADLEEAYILRDKKRLSVDFEKLLEEGNITHDIDIIPDDIIFIPDNFDKRITVIGEVVKQGTISFKRGITVLDAVLQSGGPTDDANLNDTKIIRKKRDREKGVAGTTKVVGAAEVAGAAGSEEVESISVRLKDIMKKGKLEYNQELKPKDMVVIPAGVF